MRETKEFEMAAAQQLGLIINEVDVRTQWPAMAGMTATYSPRVDVAVGPFAIEKQFIKEYTDLTCQHSQLINEWCEAFKANWRNHTGGQYWSVPSGKPFNYTTFAEKAVNRNARCFIAIEIENKNTRKHFMGSLINTGALGRIGLFVAWREEVLRAGLRIIEYFEFLQRVEKPTFNVASALVITRNQLAQSLGMQEWLDVEQE